MNEIKVFTLVISDSNYMDVNCFFGLLPPCVSQVVAKITDFEPSDALKDLITRLIAKVNCKQDGDYSALKYTDCGKEYLFHMKCHHMKV